MFTALVLLAEIGDITRFGSARKVASWAGLTPTVRGSDRTVHHGHISKQGPTWVRWVLCEAAQTAKRHPDFAPGYEALTRRRGKKIATTAVASSSPAPTTCSPTPPATVRPANAQGRQPRASSRFRMSQHIDREHVAEPVGGRYLAGLAVADAGVVDYRVEPAGVVGLPRHRPHLVDAGQVARQHPSGAGRGGPGIGHPHLVPGVQHDLVPLADEQLRGNQAEPVG
jgi:Transposase IS116/IS110/IS902 family